MASAHLVLRHISPGGDSNLHQQHLVAPLRVLLQELLKGKELLGNALDHVQPIHSQHDLQTAVLVDVLLAATACCCCWHKHQQPSSVNGHRSYILIVYRLCDPAAFTCNCLRFEKKVGVNRVLQALFTSITTAISVLLLLLLLLLVPLIFLIP